MDCIQIGFKITELYLLKVDIKKWKKIKVAITFKGGTG